MPRKNMPRQETGLPKNPPALLVGKEKAIYSRLREQLCLGGYESHTGLETLVVASRQIARMEELARQIQKLDEWTITTSTGQLTLHPLVKELRAVEGSVYGALGKLLLTPRSKSTARIKQAPEDVSVEDDCILKLLGS